MQATAQIGADGAAAPAAAGDRAPRDPAAAVEEPCDRGGVVELQRTDIEVDDLRTGIERQPEISFAAHVHAGNARTGG